MDPRNRLLVAALSLTFSAACGEDPDNPGPSSTTFPNQTTGQTTTATTGATSGGETGGESSTGGMVIEPEGPDGTCPGHGAFGGRGITVAPVWARTTPVGATNPETSTPVTTGVIGAFTDPDPTAAVCDDGIRVCISFENGEDVPALQADSSLPSSRRAAT